LLAGIRRGEVGGRGGKNEPLSQFSSGKRRGKDFSPRAMSGGEGKENSLSPGKKKGDSKRGPREEEKWSENFPKKKRGGKKTNGLLFLKSGTRRVKKSIPSPHYSEKGEFFLRFQRN